MPPIAVEIPVAWAERDACARLWVGGPDRIAFLHGQSSNDVKSLRPGEGHATTFLTGKGKMRGDGVLVAFPERLLIVGDPGAGELIQRHLEGFIVMDDVKVVDARPETALYLVHGNGAAKRLGAALAIDAIDGIPLHHGRNAGWEGGKLWIVRVDWTGVEGLVVIAERSLAASLAAALGAAFPADSEERIEGLRIEAGRPRFGLDSDEDTIPLEAGLVDALSYSKGCYTGNEVLARIKTYGHVNRELRGLLFEPGPVPGQGASIIAEGRSVGRIGSACFSPTLAVPIALALLRREVGAPGTEVEVEHDGARLRARVTLTPIVRRSQ